MADRRIAESKLSAGVEFGRFVVRPSRRELLADGHPIALGGRAFDVLMTLLGSMGNVLSKDELISRVWPGRIIEENSLEAQISALRKAFGPDRGLIRTVAGRGYQFTGEIRGAAATVGAASARLPLTNLPEPVSELIGRDAEVREVTELAVAHRSITLVGAGGVGKTRLSLEVARQLLPGFADGVWVAELAPLSDPELVPVTVAAALGVTLASGAPSSERVALALGTKRILVVLDNCEHVIEAAARMAEALMRADPFACVLATSREPLRVPGEFVYRVPSLEVPAEGTQDEENLLQAGAIRLFVARARAAEPRFSPERRLAALAAICRQLDGIPLAIELAAARTAVLGVEGLAARLVDRFKLLTGGHRTALPRHQTLQATLDWSYELLPESERVVLRRLAIFAGALALEAATAVAADEDISASGVVDSITNLVAKSLLMATVGSATVHYRLLETTRAYALEKLIESGEFEQLARRHAEYQRVVFETAAVEWETQPTADWVAAYGHQLDSVRAALDWAFSPNGDTEMGVALTVAALPLWMHLSLMEECRVRVARALSSLGPEPIRATRSGMQLYAALGLALMYTKGAVSETRAALTNALTIAESLADVDYQLRALWGLCVDRLNNGMFREALTFAEKFRAVAATSLDPVDQPIGDRMMGLSLHYLGDQGRARQHFERMLSRYVAPVRRSHIIRFQFDQRVTAHVALAAVLWLQGYPDQAMRTIESKIEDASALNHELSLCNALAKACPVALLAGNLEAAERFVAMLLDHSARHALASWQAEGRSFQGALLVKRGDVANGLHVLRTAVDELPAMNFSLRYTALLGELAEALGHAGEIAQGFATIDQALARSEHNDERWCIAELLRIKGELIVLECAPGAAAAAELLFQQGLEWGRRQGALSWELRCATSLARLWREQGKKGRARELLSAIYGRFTEGFETADLRAAQALIATLQ